MTRAVVLLPLFLPLLLAACAGEPVYEPVEVSVPVAVPCTPPDIPEPSWTLKSTAPAAPLFEKTKAALIELDQRKAYETRLKAALNACR